MFDLLLLLFAPCISFRFGRITHAEIDGLPGLTPTAAQTGQLKENQKFLYGKTDTKCARHAICKTCVEDIGCGWCATMGNCFDGNVLGATQANCSMWEFAWCSGEICRGLGRALYPWSPLFPSLRTPVGMGLPALVA